MRNVALLLASFFVALSVSTARGGAGPTVQISTIKTMPANSWKGIGPSAVTGEVGLAYSPDHDYLFRYGGCTRNRGTYEGYGYGNDLWLLDLRGGKWMQRRAVTMYGAVARPINGCNRAFTYDSKRKRFWLCHGISSHGTGGHGSMTSYDPLRDRFEGRWGKPKGVHCDSTLMCYDSKNDLVLWLTARRGHLSIFDPAKGAWRVSKQPAPCIGTYDGFQYDPKRSRAVCVSRQLAKWQPGQPLFGKKDHKKREDTYGKRTMRAWAYDAKTDKWTDLEPKNTEKVPERGDFASSLDAKNDVFLVFGGARNYWGNTREEQGWRYDTWALDLEANAWKEMKPAGQPKGRVTKASAIYVKKLNATLVYYGGGLWAYRYK